MQGEDDAEGKTNVALVTFWFGMLTAVSVIMTIGNKFIMHHYAYPNFITLLQNGTAVVTTATAQEVLLSLELSLLLSDLSLDHSHGVSGPE